MQSLNQKMTTTLLHLSLIFSERDYQRLYLLANQHPKLNRNRCRKYPEYIFAEGTQEAWADLTQEKIQIFLARLHRKGIRLSSENSNQIVAEFMALLNTMIRNKTISIWRKETFPAA